MASVYSTQFLAAAFDGADPINIGPFTQTMILRDIEAYDPSGAATTFAVYDASTEVVYAVAAMVVLGDGSAYGHWEGRAVAPPGVTLQCFGTAALTAVVSGYLLS